MIERSYGWGVGAVAMPRQRRGPPAILPRKGSGAEILAHLLHDIPWRAVGGSVSFAAAALTAMALLHPHLPDLKRPQAPPVAIAVRFLEASPPPAPAARPESPRPPTPPRAPAQTPPPVAALPREAPPPPPQKERETASPAPRIAEAAPSPRKEADLGPLPDLSPPSGRPLQSKLPDSGGLALRGVAERDPVLGEPGLSSERYKRRDQPPAVAEPMRGRGADLQRDLPDPGIAPASGLSLHERPAADLPLTASASRVLHRADASDGVPVLPPSQVRQPADTATPQGVLSAASFEFVDRSALPDLDRTRLLSLSELRTCVDPQRETDLRARLATLLSRAQTCRSGGVIYDFQHPESAWSIRIDIYNYEEATFPDRCAALQRGVECAEQGRRKTK